MYSPSIDRIGRWPRSDFSESRWATMPRPSPTLRAACVTRSTRSLTGAPRLSTAAFIPEAVEALVAIRARAPMARSRWSTTPRSAAAAALDRGRGRSRSAHAAAAWCLAAQGDLEAAATQGTASTGRPTAGARCRSNARAHQLLLGQLQRRQRHNAPRRSGSWARRCMRLRAPWAHRMWAERRPRRGTEPAPTTGPGHDTCELTRLERARRGTRRVPRHDQPRCGRQVVHQHQDRCEANLTQIYRKNGYPLACRTRRGDGFSSAVRPREARSIRPPKPRPYRASNGIARRTVSLRARRCRGGNGSSVDNPSVAELLIQLHVGPKAAFPQGECRRQIRRGGDVVRELGGRRSMPARSLGQTSATVQMPTTPSSATRPVTSSAAGRALHQNLVEVEVVRVGHCRQQSPCLPTHPGKAPTQQLLVGGPIREVDVRAIHPKGERPLGPFVAAHGGLITARGPVWFVVEHCAVAQSEQVVDGRYWTGCAPRWWVNSRSGPNTSSRSAECCPSRTDDDVDLPWRAALELDTDARAVPAEAQHARCHRIPTSASSAIAPNRMRTRSSRMISTSRSPRASWSGGHATS